MEEEHAKAEEVWHASEQVNTTVVLTRLRLRHREGKGGVCAECGQAWKCPTIAIIEAGASPEARRAMAAELTEHVVARAEAIWNAAPAAE